MRLQAQGIELEQYLAATGQDQEAFVDELRETAAQAVKVDLALRAVAEAEGIEVDDDDLDAEIAAVGRAGRPEARRRCASSSSATSRCRRYAPTSGSARRSSGCSSTSRSSTSRRSRSTEPSSTVEDDDRRRRCRPRPTITTTPTRRPTTTRPQPKTTDSVTIRARVQLPGPHGRRADQPRRAGLRPLLPAAQGAHHLPGHADRRHDRQPGLRPAAAPRVGEPRQGHQHLHQLPGRRHHRAVRDLRHDAVRQARHRHDLLRAGGLGGRGAAGGGHAGQAPGPARTPGSCCTSRGARAAARPPTSRSRPARSCGCATCSTRSSPATPARPSSRSARTPTATSSCPRTEAKEYGIIDEVISARELADNRGPITAAELTRIDRPGRQGIPWPSSETGASCSSARSAASRRSRSRSSSPGPASTSATSASTSATRSSRRSSPRPPSCTSTSCPSPARSSSS